MKITSDNLQLIAAQAYLNTSCLSTEEFLEDLYLHTTIKRLARKISKGSSRNLRLLTNHVICFTNNFEIHFSKELLLSSQDKESRVLRAVFLYLGFLAPHEYKTTELDFETLALLKEMD